MKDILKFILYAMVLALVFVIGLAGCTAIIWLPVFFLPTKGGFVIGAFVTIVTVVLVKLFIENNL